MRRAILWPQVTPSPGTTAAIHSDVNYDFGAGPMGYSWTISLNASFTLWNNYQRESSILAAKVATDNADATLRDTKLFATENITIQLAALRTAEASLTVGEVQLSSAREKPSRRNAPIPVTGHRRADRCHDGADRSECGARQSHWIPLQRAQCARAA